MDLLSAPLPLGNGATLPNRIVKSAMSENLAEADNHPGERLYTLYERLGRGGTGLHITGNVIVARGGRTEESNVVLDTDSAVDRYARWAEAAQAGGAHVWMQINHAGRQTMSNVNPEPVSPSAVQLTRGGLFGKPRPLTDDEIVGLVDRYALAASVAKQAGFDGVQIHGAHGYLVSQFLSPLTNLRDDRWGGSLDNRMRFPLEILRAMRRAVGPEFPIGIKLNSADFQKGGFTLEESMAVANALEAEGLQMLEVSGGNYEAPRMVGSGVRESTRKREAFFLEYAERMREAVKVPLLLTGGFRTAEGMAGALRSGAVDLVGLARTIAVEPDLPSRLLSGEATEARSVNTRVGVRLFDDLLQTAWYREQLELMALGQEPDPKLSRVKVLAKTLSSAYWRKLKMRFGAPPADVLVPAGATSR